MNTPVTEPEEKMTIDSVLNEPEKIAPKEPEFATKQPLKTV